MSSLELARIRLKVWKSMLERNRRDPALVPFTMRDDHFVIEAKLDNLCWLLGRGDYGCHYNDVTGVLRSFEKWIEDNEV